MPKKKTIIIEKEALSRPPIVTIMGHVDHGKTTLLDSIRQTNVAGHEHGGITQHIGAYQVDVQTKEGVKKITFIDTPGHEAFVKMRSRGASVTDIAVIVVDAKDSLKPQTFESIEHCRKAQVPFIVAINKIDLPEANVERVKKHLADKAKVLVEGYGGDIVAVPLSAKTKIGIDNLLEMILLLAQMQKITGDPNGPLEAIIIESRLDKFKGPIATIILKNGTLKVGMEIMAGTIKGKIKALINDKGENLNQIEPGMPAEILGLDLTPPVGEKILLKNKVKNITVVPQPVSELEMKLPDIKPQKLNVILKTDTFGSLEAIEKSLSDKIEIINSGVGEISESDILSAKSSKAIVIGFNVKIPGSVKKLADNEKVLASTYQIIYLLFEELEEAARYIDKPLLQEKILGKGKILAKFESGKNPIAGVKVLEGRLARNDTIRIEREKDVIGNAKINSMRHSKETIDKAVQGIECGLIFDSHIDFQINDAIISYRKTN